MLKRVSAAQPTPPLSALVAEVAYAGQHVIIERRGKPLAALVSLKDLERLEQDRPASLRPQGALALVRAWRDIEDQDLEDLIHEIYSQREKDLGRLVELDP